MDVYSHIVIGGGSAGCVLANRLSASRQASVLLLDAGRPDNNPLLKMPLACGLFFYNPDYTWGFESEPEPFANDRRIPAVASKVLGGGSSINGMVYTRGDSRDYDQWAQAGARGWSFEEVLPYFKRSERSWRGENSHHGQAGPLGVSAMQRDAIYDNVVATAHRNGHVVTDDFEAGRLEGFGVTDVTVFRGRRSSAAQTFLRPVRKRANLTVRCGAHVSRILIEKGRAVGVEYVSDGRRLTARAEQEVILSAGAFNSPKILMLSGIGPADDLASVGVPVIQDLPGVGRNLQDHPVIPITFRAKELSRFDGSLRLDRLILGAARWGIRAGGPVGDSPCSAFAFLKTRPGLERADVEWTVVGAYNDAKIWFPGWRRPATNMITVMNILLRPESRGDVTLRSADPSDPPRVRFNLLKATDDRETLLRSIRMMREFMASEPISEMMSEEMAPGGARTSDEELLAYMRESVYTNIHMVGTCAMGVAPESVVDPELKVHGIDGLRVVDASIMPTMLGAHTNAPTIMIAEKAAELILEKSYA
jgi:choline dehydrogenase